jgi:DNA-binding response OmpR family regulator
LRGTPIIFLTATVSRREAGAAGLNSGGCRFLAKPISTEHLIKCIEESLIKPGTEESSPAPAKS